MLVSFLLLQASATGAFADLIWLRILLALGVPIFCMVVAYKPLTRRLGKLLHAMQERADAKYRLPDIGNVPVLCLSTFGDEAGLWLRFWASLARLPFRVFSAVLENPGKLLAAGAVLVGVALLGEAYPSELFGPVHYSVGGESYTVTPPDRSCAAFRRESYASQPDLFMAQVIGMIYGFFALVWPFASLVIASMIGMIFIPRLTWVGWWAFGGVSLADILVVDVDISDVPECEVLCRPVPDYKPLVTWRALGTLPVKTPSFRIRHSGIYDSEAIRETLIDWLKGRMPQGRRSSQVRPRSRYSIIGD
jgi:hypothetical protein